ncbi:MAG: aminotransferase class V-fold PLP-dependent enzyme, partial [Campylobacter sp.]
LANTPPTYSIYLLGLVIEWIKEQGGLKAINAINEQKAELLYKAIDESSFFKAHAMAGSRSLMNVSFRSPSPELDALFVKEAENEDMIGLKGHRLLGGLRASIYNAVSLENVKTLVSFMSEFERKNG